MVQCVWLSPVGSAKPSGHTLLLEALVLMLTQQMPFAAVARAVNLSWHRVHVIFPRYVELILEEADLSGVGNGD